MIAAGGRQIGTGRGKHDLWSARRLDQYLAAHVDCRDTDDMLIRSGIERRGGGALTSPPPHANLTPRRQIDPHPLHPRGLRGRQNYIYYSDPLLHPPPTPPPPSVHP